MWFLNLPFLPVALDSKASNLSSLSKKYRSDAKYLNTRSTYAKVAVGAVFLITLIVYVRFWWLWDHQIKELLFVLRTVRWWLFTGGSREVPITDALDCDVCSECAYTCLYWNVQIDVVKFI